MTKKTRKKKGIKLNREWLPEVIAVIFLVAIGLYFFLPSAARSSLLEGLNYLITLLPTLIKSAINPKNLLAIIIIVAVSYFFVQRLRYHIFRLYGYDETCPVCQHHTHKLHRKGYQRWLSYLIPIRRYHCSNCNWKGLRIYHKKTRHRGEK